jgi:tetratricopeptide (TPR) repeat protein
MSTTRSCTLAALLLLAGNAAQAQETADSVAEPGLLEQTVPVADEPAEAQASAEESVAGNDVPTAEDVLQEYARFMQLLDEQNFDEADISAKRVIEMTIRVYGPVSHETAKALNNLGFVQNNIGQYDAAIQNFTSAVEIIETLEDRLNSSLVNPLRGLGAAQLGGGRPDLAARTFDRATHITHVNEGPHNIEQVEILEALAEANVRRGDLESARDVLDRIHILNVRHFQDDMVALLPSLMRRADWQHRAGYYNDERATYRRAIRVIEEAAGRDDPRLVEPLVKLGKSYYYFEPLADNIAAPVNSPGAAESYLKRANRIAESSSELPWFEIASARLALADYYLARESVSRARRIYGEVWDELSAFEDGLDMRGELMQSLAPIWQEPLPPYTKGAAGIKDGRDGDIRNGTVSVKYKVDDRGRPRIAEIVTQPGEFSDMERMVARELKRRRFRPLVVDGKITPSEMQTFTHEFRYRMSELDDIRAENAKAESGE